MEEKGLLTKAAQEVILAQVAEWVKEQKPIVRLSITLAAKTAFLVGDDKFAEKLPEELKVGTREFFDALLVEKNIENALVVAIDLIPKYYEFFKKAA